MGCDRRDLQAEILKLNHDETQSVAAESTAYSPALAAQFPEINLTIEQERTLRDKFEN